MWAHLSLLLEEILEGEDHDSLVPLLAVPDHCVRLPGAGTPVRKHCCIKAVEYSLRA